MQLRVSPFMARVSEIANIYKLNQQTVPDIWALIFGSEDIWAQSNLGARTFGRKILYVHVQMSLRKNCSAPKFLCAQMSGFDKQIHDDKKQTEVCLF